MSADYLARLQEVAEGATPGPWWIDAFDETTPRAVVNADVRIADFSFDPEARDDDATFISTFDPRAVKALLEVVAAAAVLDDKPYRLRVAFDALEAAAGGEG